MRLLFALTVCAFFNPSAKALVLPFVDDTVKLGSLKDLNESMSVLYPGFDNGIDNTISNPSLNSFPTTTQILSSPNIVKKVVYFPYTRLMVVANPNDPTEKSLGFSYTPTSGLFNATLRATADWEGLQKQGESYLKRYKQDGGNPDEVEFKPVPVRSGRYRAAITVPQGLEIPLGAATTEVKQANPRGETAVSAVYSKALADGVMTAMHTGAAVGWNYTYESPMAITPFRAKITVDWSSVFKALETDFKLKTAVTNMSMTNIARKLVQKQYVTIQIVSGPEDQSKEAAVWDIAKIILSRTFKSEDPNVELPQIEPPEGNGGITALASGFLPASLAAGVPSFGLFNPTGVTGSFAMVKATNLEHITETIDIVSAPYKMIELTAGMQIGGLCTKAPQYFAYAGNDGVIKKGCASKLIPAPTAANANDPIPPMTVAPPVKVPAVPDASATGGVTSTDSDNNKLSALNNMTLN